MVLQSKKVCYCNKQLVTFSDLTNGLVIRKCPVLKKTFVDLKFSKTEGGTGYTGIELVQSEKEGVPCSYYEEHHIKKIKRSWLEKWSIFYKGLVDADRYNRVFGKIKDDKEHLFKMEIKSLIQKVELRTLSNPMTWKTVDKLNFYATQHLLIEPWATTGPKKETFEEFFERFKKQPPIDNNYILYRKKYFAFVEKKKNKPYVREKSLAILSDLPRLQAQARKSLKKAEKKKKQEQSAKTAVDLQIEHFEKIYYNIKKSDKKFDSANIDDIDDIDFIHENNNDFELDEHTEDTDSITSSKEDDDEIEDEEELDDEGASEDEYADEDNDEW
tara:strand:- start:1434 stop:2420 length:987 start_codon:yes stop_codon:yes gene_type:complete